MSLESRLRKLEEAARNLGTEGPAKPIFYDIFEYRDGVLVVREDYPERFPQDAAEWEGRCRTLDGPDPIEEAIRAVGMPAVEDTGASSIGL